MGWDAADAATQWRSLRGSAGSAPASCATTAATDAGIATHAESALEKIDRLWATADESKRAELLEMARELAAKYGDRLPLVLRAPKTGEPNEGRPPGASR